MIELLLERIHKGHPGGFSPKWRRFICNVPLPITFPPRFDMGKGFMDRKVIFFSIGEILDRVTNFK
jgi:hypothetical protein